MPEIPEVEAFKVYVTKTSLEKKIINIVSEGKSLIQDCSVSAFEKTLTGKKFTSAKRDGKYLVLALDSHKKVVMHFGLTGSLAYEKNIDVAVKYSKISFVFANGSVLHWINKRLFGKIWLVENEDEVKGIKELGPDALKISEKEFVALCSKYERKNVKTFLMDQKLIAGIGNEYSDEILFQAGIDPRHSLSDLSAVQIKKIYTEMHEVLDYFIAFRKKYINQLAGKQYFSNQDTSVIHIKSSYLQAHRHTDQLCPKNKNHKLKIVKIGGRSAYFCPQDQK
jgi:formamidopyrimidine-DNA glycosylase